MSFYVFNISSISLISTFTLPFLSFTSNYLQFHAKERFGVFLQKLVDPHISYFKSIHILVLLKFFNFSTLQPILNSSTLNQVIFKSLLICSFPNSSTKFTFFNLNPNPPQVLLFAHCIVLTLHPIINYFIKQGHDAFIQKSCSPMETLNPNSPILCMHLVIFPIYELSNHFCCSLYPKEWLWSIKSKC